MQYVFKNITSEQISGMNLLCNFPFKILIQHPDIENSKIYGTLIRKFEDRYFICTETEFDIPGFDTLDDEDEHCDSNIDAWMPGEYYTQEGGGFKFKNGTSNEIGLYNIDLIIDSQQQAIAMTALFLKQRGYSNDEAKELIRNNVYVSGIPIQEYIEGKEFYLPFDSNISNPIAYLNEYDWSNIRDYLINYYTLLLARDWYDVSSIFRGITHTFDSMCDILNRTDYFKATTDLHGIFHMYRKLKTQYIRFIYTENNEIIYNEFIQYDIATLYMTRNDTHNNPERLCEFISEHIVRGNINTRALKYSIDGLSTEIPSDDIKAQMLIERPYSWYLIDTFINQINETSGPTISNENISFQLNENVVSEPSQISIQGHAISNDLVNMLVSDMASMRYRTGLIDNTSLYESFVAAQLQDNTNSNNNSDTEESSITINDNIYRNPIEILQEAMRLLEEVPNLRVFTDTEGNRIVYLNISKGGKHINMTGRFFRNNGYPGISIGGGRIPYIFRRDMLTNPMPELDSIVRNHNKKQIRNAPDFLHNPNTNIAHFAIADLISIYGRAAIIDLFRKHAH